MIGIDFWTKTITLDGTLLKLQLWHSVRSHRVRMPPMYFRGAVGIMFVFDMTNRETLRNLTCSDRGWIQGATRFAADSTSYVLVGTKCDRTSHIQATAADIATVVAEAAAALGARMLFIATSAKSGKNVDSVLLPTTFEASQLCHCFRFVWWNSKFDVSRTSPLPAVPVVFRGFRGFRLFFMYRAYNNQWHRLNLLYDDSRWFYVCIHVRRKLRSLLVLCGFLRVFWTEGQRAGGLPS
jgi:hypothetical protein